MGRNPVKFLCFLEVTLFFQFLTICRNVTTCFAQPGFLSIDAGSTQANYTDDIGLSWVNDGIYIRTGVNSGRPFILDNSSYIDNYRAMGDFRYFPEDRSKHCYELPTISNRSYLIRAMFYYNASKSDELQLPIQFDVFINSSNCFTIKYTKDPTENVFPNSRIWKVWEGIFYSSGSVINFCLKPVIGMPFISSLEIRPLSADDHMYSYAGNKKQYLSNLMRYNAGARSVYADTPLPRSVRFPDDKFDRLWTASPFVMTYINAIQTVDYVGTTSATPRLHAKTTVNVNYVPDKVMLDVEKSARFSVLLVSPVDYVYAIAYFEDINAFESRGWVMGLDIIDGWDEIISSTSPFIVMANASMQQHPNLVSGSKKIGFNFNQVGGSTADINSSYVNALEIYSQHILQSYITFPSEENTMGVLKNIFNLTDWQGDPCTPVPYDWLTCQDHDFDDYKSVESITLSNLNSSGWPLFMDKYETTFGFGKLNEIDLAYNAISIIPPAKYWSQAQNLVFLNLSHNALDGELFPFVDMPFIGALQELNLSNNAMTSLPIKWGNTTIGLIVFDVSHNNLTGAISSLDELVLKNNESLQKIYISNNNLRGVFNGHLYFSKLLNLTTANFDRNHIEGILNLSSWHESLQEAKHSNKSTIDQIFSFLDNNIEEIHPGAEVLAPTIMSLLQLETFPSFNKTGVLLGGNLYCKSAKSFTHRYLCRYRVDDVVVQGKKTNLKIIIITTTIGGVVIFLICLFFLLIVSKLRKQVVALQQIQQALVDREVQPPFYSYSDLKLATRDFHKDNELGSGAFGVVYKGVLVDGRTLVVKKLFNSRKVQVLNEFLNEVVLITGIKHINLVQLKGCCINHYRERILVYEYVENGNLAEAIWGHQTHGTSLLNWQQRFGICIGIARGLLYLHEELEPRIIHRDIKPANILLDINLNPKIADFGLARQFQNEQSQAEFTSIMGTRGYFAPEYASQGKLTHKADVYSFGILLLEIVSGRKVIDYNMPPNKVFLKDWVERLHKDELLLEALQPELRQSCQEDEVMRVINIALTCVQMHAERRATMSQVLTMLLGNMDAPTFLDNMMSNYRQRNSNILMPNIEESNECPLFHVYGESSSSLNYNNNTSSVAMVELSDMIGR